ncbi:MAG: malto-oligosyltrehalose trehalohydrolase [Planctomycetia bacterium]|nr:malto-oligosyltrehalose trehalohydrolase [Planctomycetia bacterium]
MSQSYQRRQPIGAEPQAAGGAHFRVWAPRRRRVAVVVEQAGAGCGDATPGPLVAEEGGYFSGLVRDAGPGSLYRFRLDDDELLYPDPASRFQPLGCHGPSEVIDPTSYHWHDQQWTGRELRGQVIYEMHVGTFTPEGTWTAAIARLPLLVEVGVTVLEVMPVAEFPGRFGWGYDGVDLFAPTRLYGRPDDVRRFVDAAHGHGLGVILDVVYNHLGPRGNYTGAFSEHYVSDKHGTPWGCAINFDDEHSYPVREFFTANAGYWIDEFHFDGLRLDAVQEIYDDSSDHIMAAVQRQVRSAARGRQTIVVAEDDRQRTFLVKPAAAGGCALDGAWNDDFHHAVRVAATGRNEFYYGDYAGTPQELVSAVKHGYLFQGQYNMRQKAPRGTPTWGIDAAHFVIFTQNHDQVANSAQGLRSRQLTSPGRHRAITALLLLAPQTPMLFQGQEFDSCSPFLFFADHEPDLAEQVRAGRHEWLRCFPSIGGEREHSPKLHDPADEGTFERSKLDWAERDAHAEAVALCRDLIRLRREDPIFRAQRADWVDGAVLGAEAFVLRYQSDTGDARLVVVNLGRDLDAEQAEPLLAAPDGKDWTLLWASEAPCYGGSGVAHFDARQWRLPGHATLVLAPSPVASP